MLFQNILGTATLKSMLHYHHLPTRSSKDELVLNVCLLRSERKYLINKRKKSALRELIKTTELLISKQMEIDVCSNKPSSRKRKFESLTESKISTSNPRAMASAYGTYVKSKKIVPFGIQKDSIKDMLELKYDLLVSCKSEKSNANTTVTSWNETAERQGKSTMYEEFSEVGVRVSVKWDKEDLKDSGWKSGWFTAEVQDCDQD